VAGLVAFVGSRSLGSSWSALVLACVRSVLGAGRGVAVGCAVGADSLAVAAVGACGAWSSLSLFAVGGPRFGGFWSGSSLAAVRAAAAAGRVRWWAGGGARVPLRRRLAARSAACVRSASACVGFLASPASVGSLRSLRLAASLGLPVVVFACGFPASALPLLGAGSWVPCGGRGVWAAGWRWAPSAGPAASL